MKHPKNVLWFLHKPQDEREIAMYQRAYHRAFLALALTLSVALLISIVTAPFISDVSLSFVLVGILFALFIAHSVGWLQIYTEDVSTGDDATQTRLTVVHFLGIVLTSMVLVTLLMLWKPAFYFLWFMVTYGSIHLYIIFWAFAVTRHLPLYLRLLLCLLVPEITVAIYHPAAKNSGKKISLFFGLVCIYFATQLFGALVVRGTIADLFYVNTPAFEPTYMQGEFVIVDRREKNIEPGMYVVFRPTEKPGFTFAEVLAVNGDMLNVKTSSTQVDIPRSTVVGKVLKDGTRSLNFVIQWSEEHVKE
ncbi:MAG: S24/S26 family peptidase [Candidatus Kerfeldbacteria bacterium]|nr:S24/S26 family peptidase [Candidatus Kerfeldbacteria bacterium]